MSEIEIRALRDLVFYNKISDSSWAIIRHNWCARTA